MPNALLKRLSAAPLFVALMVSIPMLLAVLDGGGALSATHRQTNAQSIDSDQQASELTLAETLVEGDRLLQEGYQLLYTGQLSAALDTLQQALDIYRSEERQLDEAAVLIAMAEVYSDYDRDENAQVAAQQALNIYQGLDNSLGIASALSLVGYLHEDTVQSLVLQEQSLEIYRGIDNHFEYGIALVRHSATLIHQEGQYKAALEQLDAAMNVLAQEQNTDTESRRFYYQTASLALKGITYILVGKFDQAQASLDSAIVLSQLLGNSYIDGVIFFLEGWLFYEQNDWTLALEKYQSSLILVQQSDNRSLVDELLADIANTYSKLGKLQDAISSFQSVLALSVENGDRETEGVILKNIGLVHDWLEDYPQALDYYQQSLRISREVGDRDGEGNILNNIGGIYDWLGDYPQALDYYQQALDIKREISDRAGERTTLNYIGNTYDWLVNYPQALDYHQQALRISLEIGDRDGEGTSFNNIGGIYDSLGDYPQALDYYQQALEISREIGDRAGEGITLNNIGSTYRKLGDYQQSLGYHQQSLKIRREMGDRAGEGITLNNIGLIQYELGDYPQALDYFQQSLESRHATDRAGEGITLDNIGSTYDSLGDYPKALVYYQQALEISREIGDRAGEGETLNNIGQLLDQTHQPELAIVFLKQSVSVYETIRQSNRQLSQDHQQSYTDTVSDTYRTLADLLLQENRVLEAQAVLDLLRTQELDDYFQDVRSSTAPANIDYWQPEADILALYTDVLESKGILTTLKQKVRDQGLDSLTTAEKEQLNVLLEREGELISSFNEFIDSPKVKELVAQLRTETEGQMIELGSLRGLQDDIASLPNAVLLYPLIFEDRLELILIPPDTPPIRRPVDVSAAELNAAILDYRTRLNTPRSPDPKPIAQQLYTWLIAPLEEDLAKLNTQNGPQSIIYSPDRALRYIPLAALYDGNQWLAERFTISHITVDSVSNLNTPPQTNPRILAAACAECSFTPTVRGVQYPFSDLPYTQVEVETLAQRHPTTNVLLNQDFSKEATETLLQIGGHTIVHLATHGAFVSDSPDDSFLLFGDGNTATLRDIGNWTLDGVDLVVLSACQTGVGGIDLSSGIEVLGLGYQLQRAKAKAAIASLWHVSDGGTQTLMDAFYTALNNGYSKAEALQRAQQSLITSDQNVLVGEQRETDPTGIDIIDTLTGQPLPQNHDLDHPYYWAPFILIGNGL